MQRNIIVISINLGSIDIWRSCVFAS